MTAPPFFIVASARSGTTFLRLALNAHPEVAVPPESRFITELHRDRTEVEVTGFLSELVQHERFTIWGLPIDDVAARLGGRTTVRYADAVDAAFTAYAASRGKSRWGDKTPRYIEHIPFLASLFPDARFIHPIRDGRNVALSYANVAFGPKTVAEAAELWARRVAAGMRDGRALPPGRYLEIRSEDLADDPEGEMRSVCEFLDLGFDPVMMDADERRKGVVDKVTHNYDPASAGRTRMSSWETDMRQSDVAVFEAVAGPVLAELGYPVRNPEASFGARVRARLALAGLSLGRLKK